MSDDSEQEYFADGMTEDLITDLSKISGLFVIARNFTFVYKGRSVPVRQVSEDLGLSEFTPVFYRQQPLLLALMRTAG